MLLCVACLTIHPLEGHLVKATRILALAVVVAAAGTGVWWYTRDHADQHADRLTLYGNVDIREADLAFNNNEHIDRILVQEGDRVKAGQLLATLHEERAQAEYDAAEATMRARAAVLARLKAGSRQEEISRARANLAASQAKVRDAELIHERMQKLFEQKAVSPQAMDDAEAVMKNARANAKVAQEDLMLAVQGPRTEEVDEAAAMLRADQAQLALAAEVLKDSALYAPASGVIRNRILEPGDMATPQTPVLTLAMTDPVWVRAYAPEPMLGRLVPGMHAEVATDSYPGKTYQAWIGFISPTAEFTPKNVETPDLRTRLVYQVRIYVCNPRDELRLGMPATVTIALDQAKPAAEHATPRCGAQGSDGNT